MLAFICCVFFIYLFILFVSLTEERATCVLSSLVERNQELSLQSRLLSNYNLDYFLLLLFLFDDFPDELLPIIVLNLANIFELNFIYFWYIKFFSYILFPLPKGQHSFFTRLRISIAHFWYTPIFDEQNVFTFLYFFLHFLNIFFRYIISYIFVQKEVLLNFFLKTTLASKSLGTSCQKKKKIFLNECKNHKNN